MAVTVRPRYSVSSAASDASKRPFTSSTTATFSALGCSIGTSSHSVLSSRKRRTGARCRASTREDGSEASASSGGPGGPFGAAPGGRRRTGCLRRAKFRSVVGRRPYRGGAGRLKSFGLGGVFLGALDAVAVHVDAGAHRGGDADATDVAALGRGRLGAVDLVDHGAQVGQQGGGLEAHLADRHVHVAVAVGAVLD